MQDFMRTLGATAVMFYLFSRWGIWGHTRLRLYKGDTEIGVFSRVFYDVAQFKMAGSDDVIEVWSVSPIDFVKEFGPRKMD